MDGMELGCISIALLLIGWNIESIRQTMKSIANRVLGIEWEDDDDEIKDPSEKPYKSIYIEPTKEIMLIGIQEFAIWSIELAELL